MTNIGIVTGEISNLIVLDIDPKHGGNSSLDRLERQFGQLPETIEAKTGGEGRHLYFAHPGGLIRNRTGLAQGVDLRGDGGYIVAPPSVHPIGRAYVWAAGRSPEDIALAALPRWILPPSGGARSDGPFLIGEGSSMTASRKDSAIRVSPPWPDICCGTRSTRRWCWNCSSPGTVCAATTA